MSGREPSSETWTCRPGTSPRRAAIASSTNQPLLFSVTPTPPAASRSITASVTSGLSRGSPPVITASTAPSSRHSSAILSQSSWPISGVRSAVWRGESV